jgi:carotenoid cleavage dioxygenase-like enzyme
MLIPTRFVSFSATTFPYAIAHKMGLTCHEWDENWNLVFQRSVWAPFTLMHDFCITPNYYVFLYTPGKMDLVRLVSNPLDK